MNYGIIAAGEGSRLVQEGIAKPKPLVELNGVPMIERLIRLFMVANAESISVIINEQMTQVRDFLEQLKTKIPVELNIVVKTTPSSMHSFYELSREMKGGGRFVLTTVDTIFREYEFKQYVEAFESSSEIDGMMPMTSFIDDEKPLYIEVDDANYILNFRDEFWPEAKYISGGIYGLTEPAIGVLEECIEKGISRMRNYQRALVSSGLRLKGYPFKKIVDVDHADDIHTAEEFIKEAQ